MGRILISDAFKPLNKETVLELVPAEHAELATLEQEDVDE
jgi:hypothetical protein